MGKFRKKPVVVDATQWHESGDHPEDDRETFTGSDGQPFLGEGKVVRYYRTPALDGQTPCQHCGDIMHNHGWIDPQSQPQSEDQDEFDPGHVVCPGDWIITGVESEHYPIKPDIFAADYEPVGEADMDPGG